MFECLEKRIRKRLKMGLKSPNKSKNGLRRKVSCSTALRNPFMLLKSLDMMKKWLGLLKKSPKHGHSFERRE